MATFGSLFAGVGGIDIGFDNAGGWECKFQVEWDKHCQETLKYHWPEVPKWGDVSDVNGAELPPVDLITFGSPCQDLSLAGKRAGMVEGSRSNLFFEATRIIKEMRNATGNVSPRWAIWENVQGAFSSNNGDDFEAVIQKMVDIGGHHVEWHCVDAQFFGVPQRRRRVFVIACFDSAILSRGGQEVLPVSEGRRRNTSARNSKRKALAATLGESIDPSSQQSIDEQLPWAAGSTDDDVLTTSVTSKWHKGTGGPSGSEHYNLVVEPFVIDGTRVGGAGHAVAYTTADVVGTLQARDYKGIGNQYVAENKLIIEKDIAPTLRSGGDGGVPSSRGEHLIVEAYDEYNDALGGNIHQALRAGTKESTGVLTDMVVRRLTPIECERLMGWPDNHTLHRADGKQNSDTTRYKMCGNGVASPVAQWIAEHILNVDRTF